jgi:hypothetical protein
VVPVGTQCKTKGSGGSIGGKGGSTGRKGGGGLPSSHPIARHVGGGTGAIHRVTSSHPITRTPNKAGFKSLAEAASEKGIDIGETLVWLGGIYPGLNVQNPPNAVPPPYLGK